MLGYSENIGLINPKVNMPWGYSIEHKSNGFNISVRDTQANEYETFLEGDILDQAALASVLDAIYSLRLPLIAVNYLEENNFDMKKNSNTN